MMVRSQTVLLLPNSLTELCMVRQKGDIPPAVSVSHVVGIIAGWQNGRGSRAGGNSCGLTRRWDVEPGQ